MLNKEVKEENSIAMQKGRLLFINFCEYLNPKKKL